MKKVLIAISGGIAAYKVADLISGLTKEGYQTAVITTKHALDFITPTVIGALSHNYITEANINQITHIDEAQSCDLFICIPATENIIAKFAHGIADDLVTSTYPAIPKHIPKIICPAMNTFMYESFANVRNMKQLQEDGCQIIEPDFGMLACGWEGKGKLPKIPKIIAHIKDILDDSPIWHWPIAMKPIRTTIDSYSYLHIDLQKEVEIPLYPHVGSFGVKRRYDTHRGVDLYAPIGTKVYAVEDGIVKMIRPWTGVKAECDWWEDTDAILIEGESGLVVYGEIKIAEGLEEEMKIKKGDFLGTVLRVLKIDKGRPTAMLHLELRKAGFYKNIDKDWDTTPEGLLDPTKYLIRSFRHYKKEN